MSAGPLDRVRLFWLRVDTRRSLELMTSSQDFRFDADLIGLTGVVAGDEALLTGVTDFDLCTAFLTLEAEDDSEIPLLDGASSSSSLSDALGEVISSFSSVLMGLTGVGTSPEDEEILLSCSGSPDAEASADEEVSVSGSVSVVLPSFFADLHGLWPSRMMLCGLPAAVALVQLST